MSGALVVGAGPAGSSLALHLARRGCPVTLLDAASFPRSKPCGDCFSPGAAPLLRELGLLDRVRAAGATELRGWRLRTPEGGWFGADFGATDGAEPKDTDGTPAALALPRRDLDALLVEAAVEAGASLLERHRIFDLRRRGDRVVGVRARNAEGESRDLDADLVVGADGLRSTVARRLSGVERGGRPRLALVGRLRPEASAARLEPEGRGQMRIGSGGCLGLAPVGDGLFNATLVVEAKRAREISGDVEAFFRRGLEAYGLTASLTAAPLELPVEVTGPFDVRPRRRVAPGALLVGDAAGYFDPFTGQGVYRALATARLAARHVARLLGARTESGRAAARRSYRDALERSFAPSRRLQRLVDHVVSRPSLIDPVGRLLARRPGLAGLLLRVTGDLDRATALLRPDRLLGAWSAPGSTADASIDDVSINDASIAASTPRRESLAHA